VIKSASRSSITNDQKYRSMLAGAVPSSEYLIETVTLPSDTPSVTFDNLAQFNGVYRHFQIVGTVRSTRGDTDSYLHLQFNGDFGTNYNSHYLRGTGSAVSSGDLSTAYPNGIADLAAIPGATAPGNSFGALVIDILDPFKTTKNTTTRSLSGQAASYSRIALTSGLWRNTAPITSITLDDIFANFTANTRFSLYGVTA